LIGINSSQIILIIVLGVLCTAMAHTLFIASLKTVRAQLASVTACLEPVYGIVTALLILGEYPQFREVMGGCLIITVVAANSLRDSSSTSPAIQENPPG
jgi:drug/metabolite transporter (DMT)-like permease